MPGKRCLRTPRIYMGNPASPTLLTFFQQERIHVPSNPNYYGTHDFFQFPIPKWSPQTTAYTSEAAGVPRWKMESRM